MIIPQEYFDNWIENIETRLESFINKFEPKEREQLDFSIESLKVIGRKFIKDFESISELRKIESLYLVDEYVTYLGEVYIRNDKIRKLYWDVFHNLKSFEYFPGLHCDEYSNSSVNLAANFAFILHNRAKNKFYETCKGNINYIIENEERLRKVESLPIPETDKSDYEHWLFLKDDCLSIHDFKVILENYYTSKKRDVKVEYTNERNNRLLITIGDYYFHAYKNENSYVQVDATEFATSYTGERSKADITSCKTRIEVWGNEDPNADYINEYMYIMDQLKNDSNIFIYSLTQRLFYDEI